MTNQCTGVDWGHFKQDLADGRYAAAERIVVVLDNLNTHGPGSFHETFAPAEARRLAARFEFHYTPKHGSWLNTAEIELGAVSRTGLGERIPDPQTLTHRVAACENEWNAISTTVTWLFTRATHASS